VLNFVDGEFDTRSKKVINDINSQKPEFGDIIDKLTHYLVGLNGKYDHLKFDTTKLSNIVGKKVKIRVVKTSILNNF